MTIIIKNQKHNLTQENPDISTLLVGLGWKVSDTEQNFDLDASAFMLKSDEHIRDRGDCVYYGNLKDNLGILKHSGDNKVGGDGDSEQITVNLKNVPKEIGHITFVVSIHDALNRSQTFGRVSDAYIRVIDNDTNIEIVRYNLGQEFFNATSVVIGDLLKRNDEWFFDAVGIAFSGGLPAIAQDFDIKVKA
ncbi:MAG: TerD family protein [Candidatus Sericytochromatia bacterium]|nr:TerD family protein [Candidatus Sericytochromatia bacterium]